MYHSAKLKKFKIQKQVDFTLQYLLLQQNTVMIDNAAETLDFNSIEQLDQGATTLYSITR